MATTIELPWPPTVLSPNGRYFWRRVAAAKKAYRVACYVAVKEARAKLRGERFIVQMRFVPPDRRSYDRDNLVARMKAGLDGVADAFGVDDSRFVEVSGRVEEPAGHRLFAKVRVTFAPDVPAAASQ